MLPDESPGLPAVIRARNWILATSNDDFEDAVRKLIEAIQVDLEWVRSHSRLLNRAHEWKAAAGEESLLLRGWDLEDAERWLSGSGDRDPPPTMLQRDYVACGRWGARLDEARVLYRQALLHSGRGRYQTAAAHLVRALELGRCLGQGPLSCLALSADTRTVLSGSFDGTVCLWNIETGEAPLTLEGHQGPVASVAFSPDGQTAWSGAEDGKVVIWDLKTGRAHPLLPEDTDPVTSLVFGDGRVALGLRNGFVAIVETETGQLLLHEHMHDGAVTAIMLASGDQMLTGSGRPVIGEWPGDGSIQAYALADGKSRLLLPGTVDSVGAIAIGPDGRQALRGLAHGGIEAWDLGTGQRLHELSGHEGAVVALAFAPDGATALSAGEDRTIRLWDLQTGRERRVFDGHLGAVTALTISLDGKTAVSASLDETLGVWDLEIAPDVTPVKTRGVSVGAVAFSPDGTRALTGSSEHSIQLWNTETLESLGVLAAQAHAVMSVAVSADGKLALSGTSAGTVLVWDVATGRRRGALEGHEGYTWSIAISPDGKTAATASDDKTARVWNIETFEQTLVLSGHADTVGGVAFHPNGQVVLSRSSNDTRFWDVSTDVRSTGSKKQMATPPWLCLAPRETFTTRAVLGNRRPRPAGRERIGRRQRSRVGSGQWPATSPSQGEYAQGDLRGHQCRRPDGRQCRRGRRDSDLGSGELRSPAPAGRSYRPRRGDDVCPGRRPSGQCIGRPDRARVGHRMGFARNGRWVVSASRNDGTLRWWETETGKMLRAAGGRWGDVLAVSWSPDGTLALLACVDGSVRVWDVRRGRELPPLEGHGAAVIDVSFGPEGKLAVSASMDGTVRVWDMKIGKAIQVLVGHTAPVLSVAVSPDGRPAVSASGDGTVRLWDLRGGHQLDVLGVSPCCVAIHPRGNRAWIGSGWQGNVWVWNLSDPRTPSAPPERRPDDPTRPSLSSNRSRNRSDWV